jgi:hypothetical protein
MDTAILFDYKQIFFDFIKYMKDDFCENNACDTTKTTDAIKTFFYERYSKKFEVFSSKSKGEFLYDISVMNCKPKEILKEILDEENEKLNPKIILSIESELGGSGANYKKGLLKNLSEDYFKILHSSSDYRIFIGIHDPKDEDINERANLFYRAYKNSSQEKSILLILIYGIRNKEIKNKQIQIDPNLKFEGYVLTKDQMEKLDTKEF